MPPTLPTPTILIPHLPPKTFIGVDLVTFTSTANFHGIRDLPFGWHFLYSGTTETLSLRSGGWFYVGDSGAGNELSSTKETAITTTREGPDPDIFIWKWDGETETLVPLKGATDAERQEVLRYKANLGAIWQTGGLFRYRSRVTPSMLPGRQAPTQEEEEEEEEIERGRRDWAGLTSWFFVGLLSRITGNGEIDADGRERWVVTSASTARRDADEIPGLEQANGARRGEAEFSFLPVELKRTWREGAIGRERTEAAQDRSWALGDLIRQYSEADEKEGETQILGELQFTFLMALTLLNFSCLQQWKRLLELILTSRTAIADREPFIRHVLQLLLLQLQRCDDLEGGLFAIDADEGGEFLQTWLTKFTKSVDEIVPTGTGASIKTELARLETWVRDKYEWDLRPEGILRRGMLRLEDGEEVEMEMGGDEDEETGEYAPTVVDMTA